MSLLTRLFRPRRDPRAALRPLWHRVVELAREREWYADCGVADTVEGRFDMITLVLSITLLRMEREPVLAEETALLTELFVEDMDGQLRQQGVGDHVVGKHVGKLMSTLGGRLGAYRSALAHDGEAGAPELAAVIRRNVGLAQPDRAEAVAARTRTLFTRLERTPAEALRAGEIAA